MIKVQQKLGREQFPLIDQTYYPNHREMVSLNKSDRTELRTLFFIDLPYSQAVEQQSISMRVQDRSCPQRIWEGPRGKCLSVPGIYILTMVLINYGLSNTCTVPLACKVSVLANEN